MSFILFLIASAHQDPRITVTSTPIGPVAGGIMGCFLVLALAVYWYKHHIHRSHRGGHYVTTIQVADGDIPMPPLDHDTDHEPGVSEDYNSGVFELDIICHYSNITQSIIIF